MTERQIFVPLVGQYDNIGDIILRRQLLSWIAGRGQLHVYLGPAPDGYAAALGLGPSDTVYAAASPWAKQMLRAPAGSSRYFFKPGEIQLTGIGMKEHIGMLPFAAWTRARGGSVMRVGVGARSDSAVWKRFVLPSIAVSHQTLWRDHDSRLIFNRGETMPDLAYGEGSSDEALHADGPRDLLLVSVRGDRPYPAASLLDAVDRIAADRGLTVHTVVQVGRDGARSAELAAARGWVFDAWDGQSYLEQEAALRSLYRRSALVLSDRLHVVIAALTEGAAVLGVLDDNRKIARHLAVANLDRYSVPATVTADSLVALGLAAVEDRLAMADQVAMARKDLFAVRDTLLYTYFGA